MPHVVALTRRTSGSETVPVDPSDGEDLAARVTPVVAEAEAALLRLVAAALADDRDGSGGFEAEDLDVWVQSKLALLRRMQVQIEAGAGELVGELETLAAQLLREAFDVGAGLALVDLEDAPAGTIPTRATAAVEAGTLAGAGAAVQGEQVERLSARLRALRALTARELSAVYREAVGAAAAEVVAGAVTRRAAAQHVLDQLARDGVKGFVDRSGRRWALTSYAEMAVRTGVGQAAVDGHVAVLQQAGLDLVQVSDVPRECPLCRPFEGKVLSLGGVSGRIVVPSPTDGSSRTVRVTATLDEARRRGFQHPNCRHRLGVFLPGVTVKPKRTAEPDGYRASQRQRAMERKVREWKRREALALDDVAAAQARVKVRAWQKAIREHVDAEGLKRLSYREQIGRAI